MIRPMVAGFALLFAGSAAGADVATTADVRKAYDEARAAAGRDADSQVKLALWCEANGLVAERVKHLAVAVLTDPTHATARGLMGLVEYRGKWSRPDLVAEQVRSDAELAEALAEYNARRAKIKDRADDHYALAVWCEERGLRPEATAHFTNVTRLDPSREAAWKHLGFKKRGGAWMSEERFAAIQQEAEAQKLADRRWKPLLDRWRGWLVEKDRSRRADAEARLATVNDPRAVPSIWAVFATAGAAGQSVAVGMLGQIDGQAASRALATLAIKGATPEVRRTAQETLRRRDAREFLGLLVDGIRAPVKYEVRPVGGPGSPGVLFVEGEKYNVRRIYAPATPNFAPLPARFFANNVPFNPEASALALNFQPSGAQLGADATQAERIAADTARAANRRELQRAREIERNVAIAQEQVANAQRRLAEDIRNLEATNEEVRVTNERALPVLKDLTGQDLGADPPAWQRWWTDQKGYASITPEPDRTKPTFDVIVPMPPAPPPRSSSHSCFAAGTAVRTIEGTRPIETIRVGDRLIVQDTRSGALRYTPVVAVFHNRPNATLKVTVGGEAVVATGIHRFWKAGKGWTMARDLKPGDPIRTLGGVAAVESVEADRVQPVFNLEVADGRDFFVGREGVLVHDNSLVEPTPTPFDAPPALASAAPAGK